MSVTEQAGDATANAIPTPANNPNAKQPPGLGPRPPSRPNGSTRWKVGPSVVGQAAFVTSEKSRPKSRRLRRSFHSTPAAIPISCSSPSSKNPNAGPTVTAKGLFSVMTSSACLLYTSPSPRD